MKTLPMSTFFFFSLRWNAEGFSSFLGGGAASPVTTLFLCLPILLFWSWRKEERKMFLFYSKQYSTKGQDPIINLFDILYVCSTEFSLGTSHLFNWMKWQQPSTLSLSFPLEMLTINYLMCFMTPVMGSIKYNICLLISNELSSTAQLTCRLIHASLLGTPSKNYYT